MKQVPYQFVALKNGLSLIMQTTPVNSVAVYVAVGAGSRYETTQTAGTAHFLEHMLFEGTKHFSSTKRLAEYIENVGGKSGAWTDKEYVSYHVKVPKQYLERAFVYLSEILFNSLLNDKAIRKEKGIIVEEMKRKTDNPEIDIWDFWFEWVWGGNQPFGRSTLGDEITIQKVNRKQLLDYLKKFYYPGNMAIAVVGNFSSRDAENYAKKYFGHGERRKIPDFQKASFIPKNVHSRIIKAEIQQVQLMVGFVTNISYEHKDRYVLQLMANILSAGVSSRLSHKLIYELGIAYSSWAQSWVYTDVGLFFVYGGFSPQNILTAIKIILTELRKLKEEKVSEKELLETKKKAKANIIFALETPDALAHWYTSQQITEKKIVIAEEIEKEIDKVTVKDVMRVARQYFSATNICLTLKGPTHEEIGSIEKLLTTL